MTHEQTRAVASHPPHRIVLLGHPVAHSLSPIFQNAALRHLHRSERYEILDVAPAFLGETLARLAIEQCGGNVTVPHKEAVAARAHCTPLAKRVGAVNTFWHEDGALVGHNTDVVGVMRAIREICPGGIAGAACAVLGAGGSAAGILVALEMLEAGAIRVAARSPSRAHALSERVGVPAQICENTHEAIDGAMFVINATPMGLHDDALPVDPALLAPQAAVLDLVYRRGETAWIRACREAGHRSADGVHMLLEQGAAAFECWFDVPAPRAVMWAALRQALG